MTQHYSLLSVHLFVVNVIGFYSHRILTKNIIQGTQHLPLLTTCGRKKEEEKKQQKRKKALNQRHLFSNKDSEWVAGSGPWGSCPGESALPDLSDQSLPLTEKQRVSGAACCTKSTAGMALQAGLLQGLGRFPLQVLTVRFPYRRLVFFSI